MNSETVAEGMSLATSWQEDILEDKGFVSEKGGNLLRMLGGVDNMNYPICCCPNCRSSRITPEGEIGMKNAKWYCYACLEGFAPETMIVKIRKYYEGSTR